jgi:hypothetical protein
MINEYFEEQIWKNQKYYHGTSDALKLLSEILPPSETDIIREDFRKNNRNVVYITTSLGSATRYALKAAKKFGGNPIVYEVEPDYDSLIPHINCDYITNFAKILCKV